MKKLTIISMIVMVFISIGVWGTLFSILFDKRTDTTYSKNESMNGKALVDRVEKEQDESKVDDHELNRWYMELMNLHFSEVGLLKYLEGEEVKIADRKKSESPLNPDTFEFYYFLEGELTEEFKELTDKEQFNLLEKVNFGSYEFYWGNQFSVESMKLTSDTDTFTLTYSELNKNGKNFWSQLDDPWSELRAQLKPLGEDSEFVPTHEDFEVYKFMKEKHLTYDYQQVLELTANTFGIDEEKAMSIYSDMEEWYISQYQ
ncbi:MAG: hypothetical protein ACQEWE_16210 [Bacillota bacterium]